MQLIMVLFGHEDQIFSAVIQAISIYVVNYSIVWAMRDLSVHENKKFFSVCDFLSIGITIVKGFSDVPMIRQNPGGVIFVDDDYPCSDSEDRTVGQFNRFRVYFYEHQSGNQSYFTKMFVGISKLAKSSTVVSSSIFQDSHRISSRGHSPFVKSKS